MKKTYNHEVFDLYKPLKNKIQNYNLVEFLYLSWCYSRNYTFNHPFPNDIELRSNFDPFENIETRRINGVLEFELEFLLREFLLYSKNYRTRDSILKISEFGKVINYLRGPLDDGLHKINPNKDILLDSNRWSHRQFKWQIGYSREAMVRYYKIYSYSELENILINETGVKVEEIHFVGFYLFGSMGRIFQHQYPMNSETDILPQSLIDKFFSLFATTIEDVKISIKETYKIDHTLLYSYNPVTSKPIIILDNKTFVIPLHQNLFRRITEGLYYCIVDSPGFNNAFGASFEKYIGEVIYDQILNKEIEIYKEFTYGKQKRKTSDWIIKDSNTISFIECKAKRLTFGSKSEVNIDDGLKADLQKITNAIIQVYKQYVQFCEDKFGKIKFDKTLNFIPMVVTLEPWYIDGNIQLTNIVQEMVSNEFKQLNMDITILDKFPYLILSCEQFESAIQIMNEIGVTGYKELIDKNKYFDFIENFNFKPILENEFDRIYLDKIKKLKEAPNMR